MIIVDMERLCFDAGLRRPKLERHKPAGMMIIYSRSIVTQAAADWFESSTNRTQHLRNAVALQYITEVERVISNLPSACHATLLVAFDETEQDLQVDGESGRYSFMMVHYTLHWVLDGGVSQKYELPAPPVVVQDTGAKTLLTAILKRMPVDLAKLKAKCSTLSLILVSDSARACLRTGRHFKVYG